MLARPDYNEHELLIRLKAGCEVAFTNIFDHYRARIYSVGLKFLKSSVLAEEIVQDVFLKVWLKRAELDKVQRFDAFLFTIARNCIFDRIKKIGYETAAKKIFSKQECHIDDTEYLVRQHQCQQLLQEAIDQLPPQQKQVYYLAKVEGLSHEMIAERMQLSRLTVKTHMAKALQSIRIYLNTHLHSFPFWAVVAIMIRQ